jgi:Acetyl-coenzyme A transporter 1
LLPHCPMLPLIIQLPASNRAEPLGSVLLLLLLLLLLVFLSSHCSLTLTLTRLFTLTPSHSHHTVHSHPLCRHLLTLRCSVVSHRSSAPLTKQGLLGVSGSVPPAAVLSLGGYTRFWGWTFAIVTAAIALFKREHDSFEEEELWHLQQQQQKKKQKQRRKQPAVQSNSTTNTAGRWREIAAAYRQLWAVVRVRRHMQHAPWLHIPVPCPVLQNSTLYP